TKRFLRFGQGVSQRRTLINRWFDVREKALEALLFYLVHQSRQTFHQCHARPEQRRELACGDRDVVGGDSAAREFAEVDFLRGQRRLCASDLLPRLGLPEHLGEVNAVLAKEHAKGLRRVGFLEPLHWLAGFAQSCVLEDWHSILRCLPG